MAKGPDQGPEARVMAQKSGLDTDMSILASGEAWALKQAIWLRTMDVVFEAHAKF